jgi:hypothetical protein
MSAVTVDVLTHTEHEAGLEGGTLQPLVNGACSFSSLTFKTTSYNLKGKPALLTRTFTPAHPTIALSPHRYAGRPIHPTSGSPLILHPNQPPTATQASRST